MTLGPWRDIDYREVRQHYDERFRTHLVLRTLFDKRDVDGYLSLALGIEEPIGNYSADEHNLGPQILGRSTSEQVYALAHRLEECPEPEEIPDIIYQAKVPYLKISVGSEMAMMLRPGAFWVTNTRSVWAHLVLKNNGDTDLANEELQLYREQDRDSGMDYETWRELHGLVGPDVARLAELGSEEAVRQNVEPGELKYLWGDAIANTLYNEFT